jgi:uncharacterized protein DUF4136
MVTALLVLLASGCAPKSPPAMPVEAESSPLLSASTYRTFDWLTEPLGDPIGGVPSEATLFDWRVRNAVDAQLGAKGYTRRTSEKADFLITYHTAAQTRTTDSVRDYMDYRERGGTEDPQETYAFGYTESTLILEVYDAQTRQLMWRAAAKAVVNDPRDERSEARTTEAVRRMLQRFPSR